MRGQAIVLSIWLPGGLFGMCALVLDVGSWFRADRSTQATADAAALAAVQELPDSPGTAPSVAITYANKNGGESTSSDVTIIELAGPERHGRVHVAWTGPPSSAKCSAWATLTSARPRRLAPTAWTRRSTSHRSP